MWIIQRVQIDDDVQKTKNFFFIPQNEQGKSFPAWVHIWKWKVNSAITNSNDNDAANDDYVHDCYRSRQSYNFSTRAYVGEGLKVESEVNAFMHEQKNAFYSEVG